MTRTVLRSVVGAGVVALLLAACGTPEVGAAATVGGRRISVADVQAATRDFQTLYGPTQSVPQSVMLYLLAAEPYVETLASQASVGTSPDDARSVFTAKGATPSAAAVTAMQANESLNKITQLSTTASTAALTLVARDLARDHFTVNPRYGSFDPTRGTISTTQPDWLPTPSPTATTSQ